MLNEMLPLPLPLPTAASRSGGLSAKEAQRLLDGRKLWSVHLHALGLHLHQMVTRLGCCGSPLLHLLRKVRPL